MKKWSKEWKILLAFLFIIFFVGIIGRIIPYGEEKWNFIFENMIWFSIELGVTIFFIQKMLDENAKKQMTIREFNEYYSLAKDDIESILFTFKLDLIAIATNQDCKPEKIDDKLEDIKDNIDLYFSPEKIKNGFLVVKVASMDLNNILNALNNPQMTRKSFFVNVGTFGKNLESLVDKHISIFIRYMPIDIFNEFNSMLNSSKKNIVLSANEMSEAGRNIVIQKENSGIMSKEEYENYSSVISNIFIEYYDRINKIEELIEQNKKKSSES